MPRPVNYLNTKGGRFRDTKLSDIVTLLYNIQAAAAHPEVGFEDTQNTLKGLVAKLSRRVLLDPSVLESALWSCNLLHERGEFKDYQGRDFERFLKDLLGTEDLHRKYHWLKPRKE